MRPATATLPARSTATRSQVRSISESRCELRRIVLPALRLLLEEVADLAAADRVDAVGRLVEEQDLRIVDQRRGEAEALRHALRELLDPHVLPLRQAHPLEKPRRALADRRGSRPDMRPKIDSVWRAVR